MAPAEMAVVPLLAAALLSPVLSPPAAAMPFGTAGEPGSGEPTPQPTEGSGSPETAAIDAEDRDEPLLWVELPSAWSGPWKEEGAEAGSGLGETTQRPELVEHLGSEEGEQELQFHVVAKQTRKTRRRNQTVIEEQPEAGERETDRSRLRQEYCRTTFICVFHGWATVCVIVLMFLVLRTVVNNFGSAVQWCCHLRSRHRRSDVMRAVDAINIGMDRKSWAKKSPCSPQIKAEIESRLRQLFIRCDVTLEMVGSLSSRLGKSLNARPEAEDSLQEYRFTEPVLGADADFMVVLQVRPRALDGCADCCPPADLCCDRTDCVL
ncbi:hypothetical protein FJT64_018648 [Amphibalanus amphitrite]|uniref:Uncharacterized protein n=1 Tax=Amphibalanus amphitrite TaxID=1232801 RepID=A0A6A4X7J9_AMPAM|nr:hypothetical protein FJT64_018648 [Amphibalanus amphitrite]